MSEATGNKDVSLRVCDVASLESVRQFAREVEASDEPVHVLVNNAGILVSPAWLDLAQTPCPSQLQFWNCCAAVTLHCILRAELSGACCQAPQT